MLLVIQQRLLKSLLDQQIQYWQLDSFLLSFHKKKSAEILPAQLQALPAQGMELFLKVFQLANTLQLITLWWLPQFRMELLERDL